MTFFLARSIYCLPRPAIMLYSLAFTTGIHGEAGAERAKVCKYMLP